MKNKVMMVKIDTEVLVGTIEHVTVGVFHSYVVRVWKKSELMKAQNSMFFPNSIYSMSFGDGVMAEDRLIELLEYPEITILKYT